MMLKTLTKKKVNPHHFIKLIMGKEVKTGLHLRCFAKKIKGMIKPASIVVPPVFIIDQKKIQASIPIKNPNRNLMPLSSGVYLTNPEINNPVKEKVRIANNRNP